MSTERQQWRQQQWQRLELSQQLFGKLTTFGLFGSSEISSLVDNLSVGQQNELIALLSPYNLNLFRQINRVLPDDIADYPQRLIALLRSFDRINHPEKYDQPSLLTYERVFELKGNNSNNVFYALLATENPEFMSWRMENEVHLHTNQARLESLIKTSNLSQLLFMPELWAALTYNNYRAIVGRHKTDLTTLRNYPDLAIYLAQNTQSVSDKWAERHAFLDGFLSALHRLRIPETQQRQVARQLYLSAIPLEKLVIPELQWIPEANVGLKWEDYAALPEKNREQLYREKIQQGPQQPLTEADFQLLPASVQKWLESYCINILQRDQETTREWQQIPEYHDQLTQRQTTEKQLMDFYADLNNPLRTLFDNIGYEIEATLPPGIEKNIFEILEHNGFHQGKDGGVEHAPGPFKPYPAGLTFQKWVETGLLDIHLVQGNTMHFNVDLTTTAEMAKLVRLLQGCGYAYAPLIKPSQSKSQNWQQRVHTLNMWRNRQTGGKHYYEAKEFYVLTPEGTMNMLLVGGLLSSAAIAYEELIEKLNSKGIPIDTYLQGAPATIEEELAHCWLRLTTDAQAGLAQIGLDSILQWSAPNAQAARFYGDLKQVYPTIWHQYEVDPATVSINPLALHGVEYANHVALLQALVTRTYQEINDTLCDYLAKYVEIIESVAASGQKETRRLHVYYNDTARVQIKYPLAFIQKHAEAIESILSQRQIIPLPVALPNLATANQTGNVNA